MHVHTHSYRSVTCARTTHPALLPLAADAADPLCNCQKPAPQVVRKLLPSHLPKSCSSMIPFSAAFATFLFFFFKSVVTPMVFYVFQFLFFSSTKPLHGAAHPFWTPFLPQPTQRLSAAFATLREPPSCQKVSPWPSAHPTSPLTQASWRQAPGVPPSSGLRGASFCPCGATGLSLWPSPFQLHS